MQMLSLHLTPSHHHHHPPTTTTLQANPLVRAALEEQGEGRVLVVDGGASMRCVWV